MNDTIYVGDIPLNYKFARFGNNYVDLYKEASPTGQTDYYRVYFYQNSFQSEHLFANYSGYNTITTTEVQVSNDWHYRRDLPSICFLSLVEIMILIIIVNLVTSVFKKGGVLSGLL